MTYLYSHNASHWEWTEAGAPAVGIAASIGAVTVMDSPTSAQRPYAFVAGSDGHLWVNWWDYSAWVWSDQSAPSQTANVAGPVGVLTVMDTPSSAKRPYALVKGTDGHLWVNWWDGSAWHWSDQGVPSSAVSISGPVGVVNVMDSPSSAQRPYVYVIGSDGHVWVNWWDYSQWVWADSGAPSDVVSVAGSIGALTVMDDPSAAQRPYIFVRGSDGHLWVNWWDGSAWHWSDQGAPSSAVNVGGPVGVACAKDTPASSERPYAFVLGNDGHLWVNWWDGSAWHWSNQGTPAAGILSGAGVVTVMDSTSSERRPYAWVLAGDGHLWVNWLNYTTWGRSDQGEPSDAITVEGAVGAVTVMDTPGDPQRPYTFVTGNDGNLWTNWWWVKPANKYAITPDVLTNDSPQYTPTEASNIMLAAGLVPSFKGQNVNGARVQFQSPLPGVVVPVGTAAVLTLSDLPRQ